MGHVVNAVSTSKRKCPFKTISCPSISKECKATILFSFLKCFKKESCLSMGLWRYTHQEKPLFERLCRTDKWYADLNSEIFGILIISESLKSLSKYFRQKRGWLRQDRFGSYLSFLCKSIEIGRHSWIPGYQRNRAWRLDLQILNSERTVIIIEQNISERRKRDGRILFLYKCNKFAEWVTSTDNKCSSAFEVMKMHQVYNVLP